MDNFLITRPDYDPVTNYLFHWATEVIESAKDAVDLYKERANKKEVTSVINKIQPKLVFFNGHGSPSTISGQKGEVLIKKGENEDILKDKIIYSLSCSSAMELGRSCVKKGTRAFIGYDGDFALVNDRNSETRPLNDTTAQLFLKPSNLLIKSLLKGNTTQEAYEKSQNAFSESINKLKVSDLPVGKESIFSWLVWDKEIQVLLGDSKARFAE